MARPPPPSRRQALADELAANEEAANKKLRAQARCNHRRNWSPWRSSRTTRRGFYFKTPAGSAKVSCYFSNDAKNQLKALKPARSSSPRGVQQSRKQGKSDALVGPAHGGPEVACVLSWRPVSNRPIRRCQEGIGKLGNLPHERAYVLSWRPVSNRPIRRCQEGIGRLETGRHERTSPQTGNFEPGGASGFSRGCDTIARNETPGR